VSITIEVSRGQNEKQKLYRKTDGSESRQKSRESVRILLKLRGKNSPAGAGARAKSPCLRRSGRDFASPALAYFGQTL
jgi:hypothetical protein